MPLNELQDYLDHVEQMLDEGFSRADVLEAMLVDLHQVAAGNDVRHTELNALHERYS